MPGSVVPGAEGTRQPGVRGFAIRRPADDPQFLMLDLEFDAADGAQASAALLEQRVWSSPATSPGLPACPAPGSSM